GQRNDAIAAALGCERHVPGKWRRRWVEAFDRLVVVECVERPSVFVAAVMEVLRDEPRPGAPATFSAEQATQILAVAGGPPEHWGRPVTHWTPRELAEEVKKRGIVSSISPRQVGRFIIRGRCSRIAAATGSTPSRKTPWRSSGRSRRCAAPIWRRHAA